MAMAITPCNLPVMGDIPSNARGDDHVYAQPLKSPATYPLLIPRDRGRRRRCRRRSADCTGPRPAGLLPHPAGTRACAANARAPPSGFLRRSGDRQRLEQLERGGWELLAVEPVPFRSRTNKDPQRGTTFGDPTCSTSVPAQTAPLAACAAYGKAGYWIR
jgi:hypothetical protein